MINHIVWQSPENIWFAPILIFALFFVWRRVWRAYIVAQKLAGNFFYRERLLSRFSHRKNIIKAILMTVGLIALFLVVLRPSWNQREELVAQRGRDLFIGLDVSRSMLAQDLVPDRLTVAKKKIRQLVAELSCERVGLILFAGTAFVQCPLTADKAAFFMFLDAVDADTISSGTTALDQAVSVVLDVFKDMPERKNKLLVLFTDGEDFSSSLSRVKERAQAQQLHVFTVGVGTAEGAPVPFFDSQGRPAGHMRDKRGAVVVSRLNEGILCALSADSGGTYVSPSNDKKDVAIIAQRVRAYEKEKIEDKKYASIEEQYPYFLLVSFVCFVLEWLL